MPDSASAVLAQVSLITRITSNWQGGLLRAGYGLVFAIAGTWLWLRRDIT